ncbi:MAG: YlxR family protein [Anaerolineae bacterium]
MPRKHVPQRTCVGCGKIRPKREMVRIVRTPDRGAEIDETGKRSGRGAYLCRRQECWEIALQKDRLEHALKTSLTDEERATLQEFAQGLQATEE